MIKCGYVLSLLCFLQRYCTQGCLLFIMYSVVKYDNGIIEILPSKKVKKKSNYAIAKFCQVQILYENGMNTHY